MDIASLQGSKLNQYSEISQAKKSFYSDNLLSGKESKDPEKVAGMFEAIFYRMIFQQMNKPVFGDDLDPFVSDEKTSQFKEMQFAELANQLGEQGKLGIKDLVMNEVKKREESHSPESFRSLVKDL